MVGWDSRGTKYIVYYFTEDYAFVEMFTSFCLFFTIAVANVLRLYDNWGYTTRTLSTER